MRAGWRVWVIGLTLTAACGSPSAPVEVDGGVLDAGPPDSGILEQPDAADSGADAGRTPGCGDVDQDGVCAEDGDCDDNDPGRYPGATEVCDGADLDEDCDPSTFGSRDTDTDGYVDRECCNGDECGDDCDDLDRSTNPDGAELCNDVDDNCDGEIDEGLRRPFYPDCDRDGRGACMTRAGGTACVGPAAGTLACGPPSEAPQCGALTGQWQTTFTDCDDQNANVGVGAEERFGNGVDDNCDGNVDELYEVVGGIRPLGGAIAEPTYVVVGGSLEIAPELCSMDFCVSGGIEP